MTDYSAMEAGELKPCPFCGGDAGIGKATQNRLANGNKYATFTGYFVCCIQCGSSNQGIAEGRKSEKAAADHWNRRAALLATEGE